MKINYKLYLPIWVIYFLFAFPSFYFVYKYGNPIYGTNDFFSYYKLYENWDLKNVDAPFNMRLLSSFFVYLLNKIGLNYDTLSTFDQFNLNKQVIFNAIFFNYLCVTTTCVIIFKTIKEHFGNFLLAFISGIIYILGFGTMFYELMPITDALSILIFSIVFYLYLKKSYWIIFPLVILIIQREYIFLALGLVCLLDYYKTRLRYYMKIFLVCVSCFLVYMILRKTLFYTPKYDHQASVGYFIESIFKLKFPLLPYIKQTLMTLNVYIIYLFIISYKKYRKLKFDSFNFLKLFLLFIQINIISFAAVFGNNTGRYFYILIPMVIYYLIYEVKDIVTLNE